ncbi:regulatory LuxR family protein [Streptomyces sp. 1114.5]|uniref:helix-turn-helix transcriptional regulator n=1 Tax=unclassified Streptomyces TaxID=2593676 RepID=UPI000BD23C23|nr:MULTISPECIES: helix-turn-helix transcriptional regulator [unclassified Streptomyces]RKT16648.1 regulatory LuxR family protein [Streptomyces sp. 1114.5]SOB82819.1 regulatory protein, luxR family [Streptomyces sp. 1331.2]
MGPNETLDDVQELQDSDIAVYGWVLEHETADTAAIAAATGVSREAVVAGIGRLLRVRLLQGSPDGPYGITAVPPDTAAAQLSAPVEARIRDCRRQLDVIERELNRFTPSYDRHRSRFGAVEVLANVHLVRSALNRASERCRQEVLTSQPGGGSRAPEAMEEALGRDRAMLERGIRLRTLYHHTARFNGPSQAYVAAASALGGEYRTAHELFGRLIVFDREIAFIPAQDDSWGAVVIREPSTVAYLCEIFEQTWDRATPFTTAAGRQLEEVSREIDETIVRLLAAGLKDEAVARRLGMSLRTARRHIADIMDELGAGSRFQAGFRAAARGPLDREPPDGAPLGGTSTELAAAP